MIILDTNVLSELMTSSPSQAVQQWLVRRGPDKLCTTAVCEAEIFVGIATLPEGRRRRDLEASAADVFSRAFSEPILPFDSAAARCFAEIVAQRQRQGTRIEPLDAMIAAVALANGAALATRNIKHFEDCGVTLHNPWDEG